jgi:hypothetical protein
VSEAGVPATFNAFITDDFGLEAKVRYEVISAVTGRYVTSSPTTTARFNEDVAIAWSPAFAAAGLYDLTVEVIDEAGNTGRAKTRILVV